MFLMIPEKSRESEDPKADPAPGATTGRTNLLSIHTPANDARPKIIRTAICEEKEERTRTRLESQRGFALAFIKSASQGCVQTPPNQGSRNRTMAVRLKVDRPHLPPYPERNHIRFFLGQSRAGAWMRI